MHWIEYLHIYAVHLFAHCISICIAGAHCICIHCGTPWWMQPATPLHILHIVFLYVYILYFFMYSRSTANTLVDAACHASPQTSCGDEAFPRSVRREETRSPIHYSYNLPSLTSSPLKLPTPTTLHLVVSVMMGLMVNLARAHRKLQHNKYCQVFPIFHPDLSL